MNEHKGKLTRMKKRQPAGWRLCNEMEGRGGKTALLVF